MNRDNREILKGGTTFLDIYGQYFLMKKIVQNVNDIGDLKALFIVCKQFHIAGFDVVYYEQALGIAQRHGFQPNICVSAEDSVSSNVWLRDVYGKPVQLCKHHYESLVDFFRDEDPGLLGPRLFDLFDYIDYDTI